jgi:hypothetical protein
LKKSWQAVLVGRCRTLFVEPDDLGELLIVIGGEINGLSRIKALPGGKGNGKRLPVVGHQIKSRNQAVHPELVAKGHGRKPALDGFKAVRPEQLIPLSEVRDKFEIGEQILKVF